MSPAGDFQAMQERYLREAVLTAPPATRLTMLFDKLVLDIAQGIAGIEAKDFKTSTDALVNAQEIVLHLRYTLRTDIWEASSTLAGLYDFLYRELIDANLAGDTDRLRRCGDIVAQLAAAWHQAAETVLTEEEPKAEVASDVVG